MQRVSEAVNKEEMGWLNASKTFGVPQTTPRSRARGKYKQIQGTQNRPGRFKTAFKLELEVVDHVKLFESRLYGVTCDEVRKLAFELAQRNDIWRRFDKDSRMAG
jgi:hypothetical protein